MRYVSMIFTFRCRVHFDFFNLQYPRCVSSAPSHKFLHSVFPATYFSAHNIQRYRHPFPVSKSQEGVLDNITDSHDIHSLRSRVALRLPRWLPRSNDIFFSIFIHWSCISGIRIPLRLQYVHQVAWIGRIRVWCLDEAFCCEFFLSIHDLF